jgi:hypothetical protein
MQWQSASVFVPPFVRDNRRFVRLLRRSYYSTLSLSAKEGEMARLKKGKSPPPD